MVLGGTGHWPVPSGDSPDGTERLAIPVGGSPTGTGRGARSTHFKNTPWDRMRLPHCAVKRPITFSSASAGAWFSGVPMIVTRINRPRTEPLGTASVYSLPAPAD